MKPQDINAALEENPVYAMWRGQLVRVERFTDDGTYQVSAADPDATWDLGFPYPRELEDVEVWT